ncbi:alpha/beta hydrolase [Mycobacterium nebraskense]|uniref:Alpha/beta hydrolase n=1 Tax=Mycobacterium nebraskense TaxID=244292 RepID=A0A0F5NIU7_9MYCO|nr:alpha/beta hydrolase [Mycobacterium nebraskense]KKC06800.1 alpha/beta hydrolase [Mycobacterium nebraskense]KLO45620.1 alpha/beta hydrolase [Mycobacterium nebraskense]MBI2694960.1 alpha/beta hydrolase [Mycobacterium nebraskense]MCV7121221.1 alpha/beta hydrolase [Mycobacterium nebraskense]ORW14081.1 alpha/beta hydrolase [Mycobacterium nebraskense]
MTQTNLTRPQGLTRIDPVLREAATALGVVEFRAETLPAERAHANRLAAERAAAVDTADVAVETRAIAGPGGHELNLRFYRGPDLDRAGSGSPLVLYAHGGGFVTGNLDTDHAQCVELAREGGCLLISVDYRLAPEHPCPAALDDVEAGFYYAIRNCGELNVDVNRIAVMGRDAGAALVAGLSQRMFDDEGPQILVQILHQPMLDSDATQSRREFQRTPGLNGPAVSRAWGHYLGHASASGQHVPAHRANLEGLPPTFISCAEIDPCRDEAIDYANRLLHAYVHTELHVIAAAFNGFDLLVPDWVVSQENRALHARSLRRVFAM